jgi:hypothetical protein
MGDDNQLMLKNQFHFVLQVFLSGLLPQASVEDTSPVQTTLTIHVLYNVLQL